MANRDALTSFARGAPMPAAAPAIDALQVYARLRAVHPATCAHMAAPKRCVVCGQHFRESENVGVWQCHTHIGVVDEFTRRWSCCDRREMAGGCRASDHRSAADAPTCGRVSMVPMFVLLRPAPRAESVLTHGPLSHWTVEHMRDAADQQSPAQEQVYLEWERRNSWLVLRANCTPASRLPP